MTDLQQTVDELRSFCQASDQVLTEAIREAASAYREACNAINSRLRRCEEYLGKGLRTEAIHLADADPPLLESLATLDFPERSQWEQLASMYSLPGPPKLLTQTAEALNRGYAEQQPLERLLREHRRLALSRAPLSDRLNHLRKLHTADVGNPVWADDIRNHENVRIRQLAEEIETVLARQDPIGIANAWTELKETNWLSGPPDEQINRLQGVFLRQVANELHDAVQSQRAERAIRAREKWRQMQPERFLASSDPLWGRVQSDLTWVGRYEDQQLRQMALQDDLAKLDQAMRDGVDVDDLRDIWATVGEHRLKVPQALQERYYEYIADYRKQRDTRDLKIVSIVFAVGAVALVFFFGWLLLRPKIAMRTDSSLDRVGPLAPIGIVQTQST